MILHHRFVQARHPAAPTVVYCHAFPMHGGMWEGIVAGLGGAAGALLTDFRGYGGTEAGPGTEFSIEAFAGDLDETLTAAGVETAVFCGCSMGGYTIFEFLRRYPKRVAGLVLCDTRAEGDSDAALVKRGEQIARIENEGPEFMVDFVVQNLLSQETQSYRPAVVQFVRQAVAQVPAHVLVGTVQALGRRPDAKGLLPQITVPTLIVWGEQDVVTPFECQERLLRKIAGSRLVRIPEAGHLSPIERPDLVANAIGEFLSETVMQTH